METLISMVILLMVASTLIPLTYYMKSNLYNQKTELHASETALQAAKLLQSQPLPGGVMLVEQNEYEWTYDGNQICVHFSNLLGEQTRCVDANSAQL